MRINKRFCVTRLPQSIRDIHKNLVTTTLIEAENRLTPKDTQGGKNYPRLDTISGTRFCNAEPDLLVQLGFFLQFPKSREN